MTEFAEFALDRSTGIGGSDLSAILGINPWRSPLQVWMEKRGLLAGPEESEAMEWGTRLEAVVAQKFFEETGYEQVEHTYEHRHPDYPWMIGHADAFYRRLDGEVGVLEVKTANAYALKDWVDEPPLHYQCQLQWYLALTGLQHGAFAVLIGGQQFRWVEIARNEHFVQAAIRQAARFWKSVESGEAPRATAADARAISALYPEESDAEAAVALPVEADEWDRRRLEILDEQKGLRAELDEIETRIKEAIGEAAIGVLPGGGRYTWKLQHRKEYTVKATSSRVLRRGK